MLTRDKVIETYRAKHNEEITQSNLDAFINLCVAFDCMDSESYEEAHQKMLMTMDDICAESDAAETREEGNQVIVERLRNMNFGD